MKHKPQTNMTLYDHELEFKILERKKKTKQNKKQQATDVENVCETHF